MTLPAYAWLHREDVGLQATFQEWASLSVVAGTAATASIRAARVAAPSTSGVGPVSKVSSTRRGPGGRPPSVGLSGGGGAPGPKLLPPGKEPLALPEPGRISGGSQRTTPINAPNPNVGPPAAFAKQAPRGDVATKLATKAENDAALILEKNGFEVQQLRERPGFLDMTITTRIGGKRVTRVFDTVAPTTSRTLNCTGQDLGEVGKGQSRLVLYLRNSAVDVKELKAELLENPQITRGLDEIFAIMPSGEVTYFWP